MMRVTVVVAFAAIGCHRPNAPDASARGWIQEHNTYATHFSILTLGDARRIVVTGNSGNTDTVTDIVLNAPLRRIAMVSTTHAAYISALGATDQVVACAHAADVRDQAMRAAIQAGRVTDIGTAADPDREQLISLDLDALLGFPFGGAGGTIGEIGVPVIQVAEYIEKHPLGRAEWIRFFGALLGREREADSIFNGIVERYEAIRRTVPRDSAPLVLFGSTWQGQWYVPPGNSFMARLILDAGGRYLFANRQSDGNIALDMETMIHLGSEADAWGMITDVPDPVTATFCQGDDRLRSFRSVRDQHLFAGSSSRTDLFGRASIEPDVVLLDMTCVLHPATCAGRRPVYYHRLDQQGIPSRL